MRETTRAIQELILLFREYWYFSFIYIWWIATTALCFKNKELWKQKEWPFNWLVYLIIVGALLALFYGNRIAFNAFFIGGIKTLKTFFIFLKELIILIFQLSSSFLTLISLRIVSIISSFINFSKTLFNITIILLLIAAVKYRHFIIDKILKKIIIIIRIILGGIIAISGCCLCLIFCVLMFGFIYIPIAFMVEVLQIDTRIFDPMRWFWWVEFDYLIPLLALIFYPAANLTFTFLYETLTRHPLEGSLTIRASRKIWLLVIGLLILLTGILGKILM